MSRQQLTRIQGRAVAETMLAGFNKHYRLYREVTARAKGLFETRDWHGIQQLVADRIQMYDHRVREAVQVLRQEHDGQFALSDDVWALAKTEYIALLVNHKQPELAETFFNSVSTKLLDKEYYNNQFIFVKPAISTEYIDSDPHTFEAFYPNSQGLRGCLKKILRHFDWQVPFVNAARDIANILRAAKAHLQEDWPPEEMNLHLQVLGNAFYRNKSAYMFGQIINGSHRHPFALAIVHNADNGRLDGGCGACSTRSKSACCSRLRALILWWICPCPAAMCIFSTACCRCARRRRFIHLGRLAKAGQKHLVARICAAFRIFARFALCLRRA
jgi:isocitrate dehydrogenase kinase/phosphatase